MSALDLLRTREGGTDDPAPPTSSGQALRFALGGAAAATVTALTALVLVVLASAVSFHGLADLGHLAGIAASGWLLGHGAWLRVGAGTLSLAPLCWWAAIVACTAYALRRLLRTADLDGERRLGPVSTRLALTVGSFAGGYAMVAGLLGLLALVGPAPSNPWSAGAAVTATLAVGIGLALWLVVRIDEVQVPWTGPRLPVTVRRAAPAVAYGSVVVLAAGSALTLVVIALRFANIRDVTAALAPGVGGGIVLGVGQLLYLPNLALWSVSFLAGPGFQVVDGAPIAWAGVRPSTLPLVPVFGALPAPGGFPWWTQVVVLVPVLLGVLIGRRALADVARLSRVRTKAAVAVAAAVGVALVVGLLDVVAGGAMGAERLAHVGAPALALTLSVAVELTLGALAWVVVDTVRMRRV